MSADEIQHLLTELKEDSFDSLLVNVGLGNRAAKLVARFLLGSDAEHTDDSGEALSIRGTEGLVVNFAKCCGPIPGDPVVANFSPGKGVVVHNQACPNLGDFKRQGQSWLDVQWANQVEGQFSTAIRVNVGNQRGMLATVAAAIAEGGSNIEDVRSEERDGLSSTLRFVVAVSNRKDLAAIMRRIKALPSVLNITRVLG